MWQDGVAVFRLHVPWWPSPRFVPPTESQAMRKILYHILLAALLLGIIQLLTGCDMSAIPVNPTASQVDSARGLLDSANDGKTIKLHAWQICVAGRSPEPACTMCQRDSFAWSANLIIHRDSAVNIWMDRSNPTTCMPVGLFPDTAAFRIDALGGNNSPDSVWLQMDGYSSPKYWMAWRRVTLHPDSLRIVADSVDRAGAKSKAW